MPGLFAGFGRSMFSPGGMNAAFFPPAIMPRHVNMISISGVPNRQLTQMSNPYGSWGDPTGEQYFHHLQGLRELNAERAADYANVQERWDGFRQREFAERMAETEFNRQASLQEALFGHQARQGDLERTNRIDLANLDNWGRLEGIAAENQGAFNLQDLRGRQAFAEGNADRFARAAMQDQLLGFQGQEGALDRAAQFELASQDDQSQMNRLLAQLQSDAARQESQLEFQATEGLRDRSHETDLQKSLFGHQTDLAGQEAASRESLARLTGLQALDLANAEGRNAMDLQGLRGTQERDLFGDEAALRRELLGEELGFRSSEGSAERDLRRDLLSEELANRTSLQDILGEQALDQIRARGGQDQDLERMRITADAAEGAAERETRKALQELLGRQQLQSIGAQGNVERELLGSRLGAEATEGAAERALRADLAGAEGTREERMLAAQLQAAGSEGAADRGLRRELADTDSLRAFMLQELSGKQDLARINAQGQVQGDLLGRELGARASETEADRSLRERLFGADTFRQLAMQELARQSGLDEIEARGEVEGGLLDRQLEARASETEAERGLRRDLADTAGRQALDQLAAEYRNRLGLTEVEAANALDQILARGGVESLLQQDLFGHQSREAGLERQARESLQQMLGEQRTDELDRQSLESAADRRLRLQLGMSDLRERQQDRGSREALGQAELELRAREMLSQQLLDQAQLQYQQDPNTLAQSLVAKGVAPDVATAMRMLGEAGPPGSDVTAMLANPNLNGQMLLDAIGGGAEVLPEQIPAIRQALTARGVTPDMLLRELQALNPGRLSMEGLGLTEPDPAELILREQRRDLLESLLGLPSRREYGRSRGR